MAEMVAVDLAGLAAGHYTLRASVAWQQHRPDALSLLERLTESEKH